MCRTDHLCEYLGQASIVADPLPHHSWDGEFAFEQRVVHLVCAGGPCPDAV